LLSRYLFETFIAVMAIAVMAFDLYLWLAF
jgi:hypothetical protein